MSEITLNPLKFISHSSLEKLHECRRKYELYKMTFGVNESTVDTAFGHAVHAGLQKLITGGTYQQALFECFVAWDTDFDAIKPKTKKSLPMAMEAIRDFKTHARLILDDWEIATFNDKPAIELNVLIKFPNGFRYRMFIDVVLRNKRTGKLLVVEVKTTAEWGDLNVKFLNSNQALAYSVVVDAIQPGATEYFVWYYVWQSKDEEWNFFDYDKDALSKANWIRNTMHDIRDITMCIDDDYFPTHGESCLNFGRSCEYAESCNMSKHLLHSSSERLQDKIDKELKVKYDFEFTLEELLSNQLKALET